MTIDKHFNFGKLDTNNKKEWQSALAEKLLLLSGYIWQDILTMHKKQGIETLPNDQLNFYPQNYEFSKGEKVIVVRFNHQNGRIIGIKKDKCPIFYIIGFDTSFNAYKH